MRARLMLLCAVTFLWAGGTLEPQDPFAIFRTSFRVLLDQQLTGLPIEFPNPEALQNLLNRGREFVTYFKRPSQSETKASMIAECLAKPDENPFCAFLGEGMLQYLRSIEDPEFRNPRGRRGPSSVQPSVVLEKLYNSDFTGLDTVSRAQVQRLLRHIPEPEDLIAVSLYTLKQPSCAPVALLTGLALKAEEFLPESRFRDLLRFNSMKGPMPVRRGKATRFRSRATALGCSTSGAGELRQGRLLPAEALDRSRRRFL